ncbi:MAG: hypothetical protein EOM67_14115 [Spirochaetia bacterium]|jgi:hypothetical protein|nr:hypothetical protein [Spirochaetia bacterium]
MEKEKAQELFEMYLRKDKNLKLVVESFFNKTEEYKENIALIFECMNPKERYISFRCALYFRIPLVNEIEKILKEYLKAKKRVTVENIYNRIVSTLTFDWPIVYVYEVPEEHQIDVSLLPSDMTGVVERGAIAYCFPDTVIDPFKRYVLVEGVRIVFDTLNEYKEVLDTALQKFNAKKKKG